MSEKQSTRITTMKAVTIAAFLTALAKDKPGLTAGEAGKMAEEALGYPIGRHARNNIIRELDLPFKIRVRRSPEQIAAEKGLEARALIEAKEHIKELQSQVETLTGQVYALARHEAKAAAARGYTVAPDVAGIIMKFEAPARGHRPAAPDANGQDRSEVLQ